MKLESVIRFGDEKIKCAFTELKHGDDSEKELYKIINQALDNIEKNAFCGIQIPKKLIPKSYLQKYGVQNLWKYDLPKGWRLIYSVLNDEVLVVTVILEWFDHKEYERRFKY